MKIADELGVDVDKIQDEWYMFYRSARAGGKGSSQQVRVRLRSTWIEAQRTDEKWSQESLKVSITKGTMAASTFCSRTRENGRWSKLNEIVARLIVIPDMGIGIESLTKIQHSVFVAEYVGDILSDTHAKGMSYELQSHLCSVTGSGLVIDGVKDPAKLAFCDSLFHSFASFANHSKTPNCYLCVIETINRVFLITIRDIQEREQLTINYGNMCFAKTHEY